jgi:hypothetical protein
VDAAGGHGSPTHGDRELIPREFLKVIAVWSLIPGYLLAGGLLGYWADSKLGTFPYITGVGLLLALVLAVRDVMRLRDMW